MPMRARTNLHSHSSLRLNIRNYYQPMLSHASWRDIIASWCDALALSSYTTMAGSGGGGHAMIEPCWHYSRN
jgi:hypothetical protein